MNHPILLSLSLLLAAQAPFAGSYTDSAVVTSVDKIYKMHTIREPYQDCYIKEFYQAEGDGSATNEIVGGLFGGLIGNQFGDGSGKDAMTVAGALLGASLAHDDELEKSKTGRVVSREVCETKYRTESQKRLVIIVLNINMMDVHLHIQRKTNLMVIVLRFRLRFRQKIYESRKNLGAGV